MVKANKKGRWRKFSHGRLRVREEGGMEQVMEIFRTELSKQRESLVQRPWGTSMFSSGTARRAVQLQGVSNPRSGADGLGNVEARPGGPLPAFWLLFWVRQETIRELWAEEWFDLKHHCGSYGGYTLDYCQNLWMFDAEWKREEPMILGLQLVKLLCMRWENWGRSGSGRCSCRSESECNSLLQKEIFISLCSRPALDGRVSFKATDVSMVITQRSGSKDPIFYMTLKRKHMACDIIAQHIVFIILFPLRRDNLIP